jgi:hypothetical protein
MSSPKFFRAICPLFVAFTLVTLSPFSVSAQPGPPIRTGLWAMQKVSNDAGALEFFTKSIRENHQLSGVCLHVAWKEIEKEPGKPDFGAIDKFVSVLHGTGMKYQLCLKPGADTPSFVYAQGAQSFETRVPNRNRPDFGQVVVVPVPWDPVYERDFSKIIAQLGERYAGDPLCVSVVLTCANFLSAEMHLPKNPQDLAKWKALGNYEERLLAVYQRYTNEWGKAFPRQEISLHISKVLDLPPRFCERVIDYGLSKYPARFTIQNCQLTGRREDMGIMSYDLILRYRDRAHHGFQSLASLAHGNGRMGSIEIAVLNMVHAQGEYWELWHNDGLSAETSAAVARGWEDGKKLGYDAYKKKLISEGKYREPGEDSYRPRGRRRSDAAQTPNK